VGQHLSLEKRINAPGFQKRHLLGVSQVTVRFVLDDDALAVQRDFDKAAQRARLDLAWFVRARAMTSCADGSRSASLIWIIFLRFDVSFTP